MPDFSAGLFGQAIPGLLEYIDSRKRAVKNQIGGLLDSPVDQINQWLGQGADWSRQVESNAQDARSVVPEVRKQGWESMANTLLNAGGMLGIVTPKQAIGLKTNSALPVAQEFRQAVSNTPGAAIVDNGLTLRVQRNQLPDQALEDSVRGGVFYLPEGSTNAKYYRSGITGNNNTYGGPERISGETLIANPLFVKGATGGAVPAKAYDLLNGKGSFESMRADALKASGGYGLFIQKDIDAIIKEARKFLDEYAPELKNNARYIVENSAHGNQLPTALQEAAVASALRSAGHDSALGYSVTKQKKPFLSELFDVREKTYPDKFGTPTKIWESFK